VDSANVLRLAGLLAKDSNATPIGSLSENEVVSEKAVCVLTRDDALGGLMSDSAAVEVGQGSLFVCRY
jgi:hypothetical protein